MSTNKYFRKFNYRPEQNLVQGLVNEVIQIAGVDVYYLPRTLNNMDNIYGEDDSSSFEKAYSIDMYIDSTTGFEGQGDFLSRFGLEINDQLMLTVSKDSFEKYVPNNRNNKPMEGDLIYLPWLADRNARDVAGSVFEIKFVEDEEPFYYMGKNFQYKIRTELFQYSGEKFRTGIPEIDDIEWNNAYTVDITLGNLYSASVDYTIGERVTVSNSNSSIEATVSDWSAPAKEVSLIKLTGEVPISGNVIGQISGTDYAIFDFDDMEIPNTSFDMNKEFENDGDNIETDMIDHPFGNI